MIIKWIEKMFKYSFSKEWYETYWAIDVHGVIFRPNHRRNSRYAEFYPFAKETLQILSNRPDIVLIMFTSSYPEEVIYYNNILKENGIIFKYINDNPEIDSSKGNFGFYDKKFYFNVLFDDKAGFDPETEWEQIYHLLLEYETTNYKPNPNWTTKK